MSAAKKMTATAEPEGGKDDLAAEWVAPAALTPWSKNPKPIDGKDVREMSRSIRRFGFGAPIVARRANSEVIEGHLRLAAALRLRLERVPVRYLDISADEAHLLALAAIKFESRRETNDDELAAILDDLEDKGVDLTVGTGYGDDEIEKLLDAVSPAETGAEGDAAEAGKRKKRSKLRAGLTYRIVIDCTDEMHQAELLARLELEGLTCKPLIS